MNSRRPHHHERSPQQHRSTGRDDDRNAMRESSRPNSQFGSHDDWRDGNWQLDSREPHQPMGASDERFGSYTGYESRDRGDWARSNPWDEDAFNHAEAGGFGRSTSTGYSAQGRFGNDWPNNPERYYGQNRSGGDVRYAPSNLAPRNFGQEFGPGFNSSSRGSSYQSNRYGHQESSHENGGPQNWSGNGWANAPYGSEPRSGSRFGQTAGFSGHTPKGYTRSDERIRDDVCEQLSRAHDIDVRNVSVETKNGTVTLEGTVSDRRMKHRIEDLCEQSIGVNDVDNRIRVVREDAQGFTSDRTRNEFNAEERMSNATGNTERSAAKKGSPSSPH